MSTPIEKHKFQTWLGISCDYNYTLFQHDRGLKVELVHNDYLKDSLTEVSVRQGDRSNKRPEVETETDPGGNDFNPDRRLVAAQGR